MLRNKNIISFNSKEARISQVKNKRISNSDAIASVESLSRSGEIWLLIILNSIYTFSFVSENLYIVKFANIFGPVYLTIVLLYSCFVIASASAAAMWTPLFWFRLACSAYFGFGALVPHIVNRETLDWIYELFYFSEYQTLKVNLICGLGIMLTLMFSKFLMAHNKEKLFENINSNIVNSGNDFIFLFGFAYLFIGGAVRYIIILPYEFGIFDFVVPGILYNIASLFYAGVFLIVYGSVSISKKYAAVITVVIIIDVIFSIASFAKSQLIFILVFTFFGLITGRRSRKLMIFGAATVFLAYSSFGDLVSFGRDEMNLRYGEIKGGGFEERLEIVDIWLNKEGSYNETDRQASFSRVSYMNVNTFVVDRYDSGYPGETFKNAAAVLVPRALWPDKPIIANLGADLYRLVYGRDGSQLGVGHFAEFYWNFGWKGLIPLSFVLAVILTILSRFTIEVMLCRRWIYLPLVFLGVTIGLRVDGHFVVDALGPAWIAAIVFLPLYAINGIAGAITSRRHVKSAALQLSA